MFYKEKEWRALLGNKSILIAGYGREGRSTESFFSRFLPPSQFVVSDGNEAIRSQAAKFDYIIKSPGIPSAVFEECCDMSHVTSQTDLFLRIYGAQTIGVTGTKGKSTTTELIYTMLFKALQSQGKLCESSKVCKSVLTDVVKAGNMGIPLFDVIPMLSDSSIVVAELSCHQLEHIQVSPHIGVLLNLYQEHLDHYHSYLDYQMAKMNIGLKQGVNDVFFYCADNETLSQLVDKCSLKGRCLPYHCPPADTMDYSSSLMGDHNRSNFLVASWVANLYGVPNECIMEVGRNFKGLHHRMERVGKYNGITFYNDSISTIPEATIAAVSSLPNVQTLILGGYDRGIDYTGLANFLVYSQLKNVVFVGAAGSRMYQLYKSLSKTAYMPRECFVCNDYEAIVDWCFEHTEPGCSCLLSPAAASYDAFKNFEERGTCFENFVRGHDKVKK